MKKCEIAVELLGRAGVEVAQPNSRGDFIAR
jgi:hypothetical protein